MTKISKVKFKIILIGNRAVGKTSLVRRFVLNAFSDNYISTIGMKISRKIIIYDKPNNGGKIELNLMIWDLMGQEECESLQDISYVGTKGAILVSDLTRINTLGNLPTLAQSLLDVIPDIPMIFIGNKNDLVGKLEFTGSEMTEVSKTFNAPHFITSAKTGDNVEEAFRMLGEIMLMKHNLLN